MSKVFPLAVLAGVGAWFARNLGNAPAAENAPQSGQGGGSLFGTMWDAIMGTGQAPSPAPQVTPLPRDLPLSMDAVFALARRTVTAHGFAVSAQELTVTAYIESSFRPWVFREEKTAGGRVWDTSYGLMQTLLGTAQDLYNKGYRAHGVPTANALKTPEISMYFGAAYKDWLKRSYAGKSAEWYVRAYNGGPGWERTQNGPANTAIYYGRYITHAKRIFGAV